MNKSLCDVNFFLQNEHLFHKFLEIYIYEKVFYILYIHLCSVLLYLYFLITIYTILNKILRKTMQLFFIPKDENVIQDKFHYMKQILLNTK